LEVVCVTRPGRWGNPFYVTNNVGLTVHDQYAVDSRAAAVDMFDRYLRQGYLDFTVADVQRELAGKNLACWCPIGRRCHADILLEIANGPVAARPASGASGGGTAGGVRKTVWNYLDYYPIRDIVRRIL
jgi:hypothetical protein